MSGTSAFFFFFYDLGRANQALSTSDSMVVIVVSVAVRGPGVEDSLKGDPSRRWTVLEAGFFEAIGVISFAFVVSSPPFVSLNRSVWGTKSLSSLLSVPPQLSLDLWISTDSYSRSIRSSDTRFDDPLRRSLPLHVYFRLPSLH